ncbi:hypothetical protein ILYODFUR_029813 [Ilyodon furcidens]|uniref:Uncharacterized protein n=1 Tax=Ilyodon furcidens TaxID=33524 RepID=A0ABV0T1D2_9TELE
MSSVSSLRKLTNKQLSPAEETFTDIKEIIVKSEEEIDGGLDVSETTPIINHLTDSLQRYVKKEEDSSDQKIPKEDVQFSVHDFRVWLS